MQLSEQIRKWSRPAEMLWLLFIVGFAILHVLHLSADFPNGTPWYSDWAKYTDEGWYGNAAIRSHLFGHWYMHGDFNPLPAVPVWPLLEWVVFFFTGVTIQAARALSVGFFLLNLVLSYFLLRRTGSSKATTYLALTFLVTSPFLYSFSRLAILEPMLVSLLLSTLLIALRLKEVKRPIAWEFFIGLLLTLMLLTKTTTVFLLPALGWAMLQPVWPDWRRALRMAVVTGGAMVATFGAWMAFIVHRGLLADYKNFFFINNYQKPPEFYWPVLSFWWSFHGALWIDVFFVPLAGVLLLIALWATRELIFHFRDWLTKPERWNLTGGNKSIRWALEWFKNPLTGISVLVAAGYIGFMTYQNHPQPRYFAVVAYFICFLVAQGIGMMLDSGHETGARMRAWGWLAAGIAVAAVALNGARTISFALHPQYTYVTAARNLTDYIDQHPNGNRILVSISGDEITLMTHLPSLCDDFGTMDLPQKLNYYKPGWYAAWNDMDPGSLEDLHTRYSLEQVASFPALDDPERNVLVLFKLHRLAHGQVREVEGTNLQQPLGDDKMDIPVE